MKKIDTTPLTVATIFADAARKALEPVGVENLPPSRPILPAEAMAKLPAELKNYAEIAQYILQTAELASSTDRFDGIRFGLRIKAKDLTDTYAASRNATFTREAKLRILLGNYILSKGNYEHFYDKSLRARTVLLNAAAERH